MTTGSNNVSAGSFCLDGCTTGSYNVALGHDTARNISTGGNNVCLGHFAGHSGSPSGAITTGSNIVCIGNNNTSSAFIKVAFQTGSDKRDKTDIKDFSFGLDWINKMRPVIYRWDNRDWYENGIPDGSKKASQLELGLIAQEELEIEKQFGFAETKEDMLIASINANGSYTMKYDRIIPILVNAIKELSAKVAALEVG